MPEEPSLRSQDFQAPLGTAPQHIIRKLADELQVSLSEVEKAYLDALEELEGRARIRAFLPILLERRTKDVILSSKRVNP
jgi:DNA-binding transcriptional MocR family regulator